LMIPLFISLVHSELVVVISHWNHVLPL